MSDLTPICTVRCQCGRPIQQYKTNYARLLREGRSMYYALNHCGLVQHCPLEKVNPKIPSPSPSCCRITLMCSQDHTPTHVMYQHAIAWGEGPTSVGMMPDVLTATATSTATSTLPTSSTTLSTVSPFKPALQSSIAGKIESKSNN